MGKKAIIFDRDGTLIIDRIYLNDPNDIEYLPKVFTTLKTLQDAGYIFCVATNQSGIPRGLVELGNLKKIHQIIKQDFAKQGVEIAGFYYAPHLPDSNHNLRKPNTGMLDLAAKENDLNLSKSWMIGDRMTDVEAGHRAGAKSILLSNLENPKDFSFAPPDAHVQCLSDIVDIILT